MTTLGGETSTAPPAAPGLKKMPPYWYPYTTYAKERWLGRELLEVVSTEFRDRSMEYYRYALESGVTTINGQVARPDTIIQNGDRMENVVHRHEPPVSDTPVKILLEDKERDFLVVDKPGSIPVHASGRYHRNTLVAILMSDFGYEKAYTVNRLDRLTSGLMIIPTSGEKMGKGGIDIVPSDERSAPAPPPHLADTNGNPVSLIRPTSRNEPSEGGDSSEMPSAPVKLLPRETGEDIGMGSPVPLSSEAVGVITRLRNQKDEEEDWSRWRDVIFRAKGTLRAPRDLALKKPPPKNKRRKNKGEFVDEQLNAAMKGVSIADAAPTLADTTAVTADIPLSEMTSEVSTPLKGVDPVPLAPTPTPVDSTSQTPAPPASDPYAPIQLTKVEADSLIRVPEPDEPIQLTTAEAIELAREMVSTSDVNAGPEQFPQGPASDPTQKQLYCPECYLPLHPDPNPEKLYIFLHALKYTTSLGSFETEMPTWSREGFTWDRS